MPVANDSSLIASANPKLQHLTKNRADVLYQPLGGAVVVSVVTKTHADSPYLVGDADETILVDSSAGPVVVTLPVTPAHGRSLNIKKITSDVNLLTVARNGKKIEGGAADLTDPTTIHPGYTLVYDSVSLGWWIV